LLTRKDQERRCIGDELRRAKSAPALPATKVLHARLAGFLSDWGELLRGNTPEARRVLDGVLTDRIRFEPDQDQRRYTLKVPIAFDRLIEAVIPELRLQDMVASPTGNSETYLERPISGDTRRAA
jgi:hypothetical protein